MILKYGVASRVGSLEEQLTSDTTSSLTMFPIGRQVRSLEPFAVAETFAVEYSETEIFVDVTMSNSAAVDARTVK